MNRKIYVAKCNVGLGIFAMKRFEPGDLILSFAGRRISQLDPVHLTEEGANLLQIGKHSYIFPSPPGLYANHSCDPNSGIEKGRRLIAIRQIDQGEEIRFDYSTTMDDGLWEMQCKCGQINCRYTIRDFRELPDETQERYILLGIVPKYLVRAYRPDMIQTVFWLDKVKQVNMN